MSVKKVSDDGNLMVLELDNGDLNAFSQVMHGWGFKDEQSLLRFALGAMITTSDHTLTITKSNGVDQKIAPADDFLTK